MRNRVVKIISGGQTGADRAALDFALENGIEIGGFIPKGRIAEDGQISQRYTGLIETRSSNPAERTELNVHHADATLILSHGAVGGGAKLTEQFASQQDKPCLHIDLLKNPARAAARLATTWLALNRCKVLNIAGPRLSEDPAIYDDVLAVLQTLFLGGY